MKTMMNNLLVNQSNDLLSKIIIIDDNNHHYHHRKRRKHRSKLIKTTKAMMMMMMIKKIVIIMIIIQSSTTINRLPNTVMAINLHSQRQLSSDELFQSTTTISTTSFQQQQQQNNNQNCNIICQCKWKSGKETANCDHRSLQTIPTGLSSTIQVIDLNGNMLNKLPAMIFVKRGLLNLQRIYMANCHLGLFFHFCKLSINFF